MKAVRDQVWAQIRAQVWGQIKEQIERKTHGYHNG